MYGAHALKCKPTENHMANSLIIVDMSLKIGQREKESRESWPSAISKSIQSYKLTVHKTVYFKILRTFRSFHQTFTFEFTTRRLCNGRCTTPIVIMDCSGKQSVQWISRVWFIASVAAASVCLRRLRRGCAVMELGSRCQNFVHFSFNASTVLMRKRGVVSIASTVG